MEAINAENASYYQQLAVDARKRNKLAAIAAQTAPKEDEITIAIKKQIASIVADMGETRSRKEKDRLSRMVERLWNLVYPRAGARRPSREDQRRRPLPVAQDAWTMADKPASMATQIATNPNETQKPQ